MATLRIPIAKAGPGVFFEIDEEELQIVLDERREVLIDLLARGLKDALNSRMTKGIEAPTKLLKAHGADSKEFQDNKAAALAKAEENWVDLKVGKLTKKARAPTAEKREVITAARRLAREVVKNAIRQAGGKPSHYSAAEITKWADIQIAEDPSYIEQAKAELERLANTKPKAVIDIKPDAKLVARAKAKADEKKTQLSATQAGLPAKSTGKGKVAPRKGSMPPSVMTAVQAQAHHSGQASNLN